jgi:hypothetical protein
VIGTGGLARSSAGFDFGEANFESFCLTTLGPVDAVDADEGVEDAEVVAADDAVCEAAENDDDRDKTEGEEAVIEEDEETAPSDADKVREEEEETAGEETRGEAQPEDEEEDEEDLRFDDREFGTDFNDDDDDNESDEVF